LNQELHGLWDQADCCPMLSWTAKMCLSREGKGREGKGREGKGREGKGREGRGGKGREEEGPAQGYRDDEERHQSRACVDGNQGLHAA